jgi:hypothetical protein
MTSQELGATGELYTMRLLQSAGLRVEAGGPADLLADGIPIEVKAARPGPYRTRGYTGYQFCLRRDGRNGLQGRVVVLLCYWHETAEPVAFVIPAEALGKRRKVVIPGQPWTYAGAWARWYQRWETIADVMGGNDGLPGIP